MRIVDFTECVVEGVAQAPPARQARAKLAGSERQRDRESSVIALARPLDARGRALLTLDGLDVGDSGSEMVLGLLLMNDVSVNFYNSLV